MSPKSRTRKPKSAGKNRNRRTGPPSNPVADVYRTLAPVFAAEADHTSSLHSELLASELYSVMHETTNLGPGIDAEMFGDWVRYVERQRDASAAAMLWALAHIADPPADVKAAAAAQRLTDAGVAPPAWLAPLRKLEATEAWMLTDVFGDSIELVIEFRTGRRKHAMAMTIDTNHMGGYATSLTFDESARKLLKNLERFVQHMDGLMHIQTASLTEARTMGIAAIDATDITSDPDLAPEYAASRSLALSRLRALPGGAVVELADRRIPTEAEELSQVEEIGAENERLAAEFLADLQKDSANHALRDLDEEFVRLAELAIMYGRNYDDGRLLRVSPPKISSFTGWFLPRKVMLDDEEREALPLFLEAWIAWCGKRQQLPALAIELVQHAAATTLDSVADRVESGEETTSPSMAFIEGLDMDTMEEVQDAIGRRQLAMPYFGTRIGAEDYPQLNANRADELRLLVLGELEELHGVGKKEYPRSGEPDGSPVWDATLRELVVSQLWHNDPPQVWEAAVRLQSKGLNRLEILAQLQGALSGACQRRQAPTPDRRSWFRCRACPELHRVAGNPRCERGQRWTPSAGVDSPGRALRRRRHALKRAAVVFWFGEVSVTSCPAAWTPP